jgi:DNA-binding NarL/FixJ family response regulator
MQVVSISSAPLPDEQLKRLEQAGCRVLGKASAADTHFAVLKCLGEDHGLTPRQLEVLQQIMHGHSVAEVARKLRVSRKTVERHLRNCRQRLAACNDVQLGAVAERLGF